MLWKWSGSGSPTKTGTQISGLLEAFPKELNILEIEAPNNGHTLKIKGNSSCDKYVIIAAS